MRNTRTSVLLGEEIEGCNHFLLILRAGWVGRPSFPAKFGVFFSTDQIYGFFFNEMREQVVEKSFEMTRVSW
ncbi:hypothetical protein EBR21_06850 [bacterium]|nr:hypothetical protein [bacterium]